MRQPFDGSTSGTSILELIIASAMLAIVGLGASFFFRSVGSSDNEARARKSAADEVTMFLNAVERDFKLRDQSVAATPVCNKNGLCNSFTARRFVKGSGTAPEKLMTITYATDCVAAPSRVVADFAKNGKFSFSKQDTAQRGNANKGALGSCLEEIDCPAGEYPRVLITMENVGGVEVPSYPRRNGLTASFPNLDNNQGITKGIIGAAICAESSGASNTADRIHIDGAFVNAEGVIRIEKREVSIPRGNVAKIQILPNK